MIEMVRLPHVPYEVPVDIFLGARVAWFMEDAQQGRWRLRHFTVTDEQYGHSLMRAHLTAKRPDWEKAREVPPGDWITLQRRMTEQERQSTIRDHLGANALKFPRDVQDNFLPPESQWMPVMSDTPSEIIEHALALNKAHGRVLITGLGLGCLPHALLNFDTLTADVTGGRIIERIDIIEIDMDVIALTGPYLADPRVFVWHGSAEDPSVIPAEVRDRGWDYAWHDIWSTISDRNLRDDEAEHGISYGKLFKLWTPHIRGEQDAWAYEQANAMQVVVEAERFKERQFRSRLRSLPLDDQVALMMRHMVLARFNFNENTRPWATEDEVPLEAVSMIDPDGSMAAHVREQFSDPEFWERFKRDVEDHEDDPDPLGRPNEEIQ